MKKNTLYKNIEAILSIFPHLAQQINKSSCPTWLKEIKSENKQQNILVNNIPMHNIKNPWIDARKHVKGIKYKKDEVSVILGLGLGYLARTILNRMEKGHIVVIVEPIHYLIKLAFKLSNYSAYIKNKSLFIVSSEEELSLILSSIDGQLFICAYYFYISNYTLTREEYIRIGLLTKELINQLRSNTGTVTAAGATIADNDISSLPYVIRHRGIIELLNLYPQKPAILVSTGPSLAKNIHHLIGLEDRAIIIAVAPALRILLAYGIKPDFICTVDYGETNISHFKGVMESQIPLVALNKTYVSILKQYQGPKFITIGANIEGGQTTGEVLKDKGCLLSGGSVAHLCFNFAMLLGCSPLIIIGQDLSLSDTSHIKQADSMGDIEIQPTGEIRWKVTDPNSNLFGETYSMGAKVLVPGYFGGNVPTNTGLLSFLTTFERTIAVLKKGVVINATEGGAHIKGAMRMRLKDAIKEHCQKPIKKPKILSLLSPAKDGDKLIEKSLPLLERDIKNFDTVIDNSKKGLKTCKEMRELQKLPNESKIISIRTKVLSKKKRTEMTRVLLEKNWKLTKKVSKASQKNSLLRIAIFGANRDAHHREMRTKKRAQDLLQEKDKDQFLINIQRNEYILTAAKKAAESLKESYQKAFSVLEEYNTTKDIGLLKEEEPEFEIEPKVLEEYIARGNFAFPLVYCQRQPELTPELEAILKKAIQLKEENIQLAIKTEQEAEEDGSYNTIKYLELIDNGTKLGAQKEFEASYELIKKANKLMPDEEKGLWGVASAEWHLKKYDQSIKSYEKLLRTFNKPLYKHELGQVLICKGEYEKGLKILLDVMSGTDQFDKILLPIANLYRTLGQEKKDVSLLEKGIEAYKLYLKKFPQNFDALTKLGYCLFEKGKQRETLGESPAQCFFEAKKSVENALILCNSHKEAKELLNRIR